MATDETVMASTQTVMATDETVMASTRTVIAIVKTVGMSQPITTCRESRHIISYFRLLFESSSSSKGEGQWRKV